MKTRHVYILLSFLFSTTQLFAQFKPGNEPLWYVGINGGILFGEGSFTSFGADKSRTGYNVGALAGYQINSIFSTEIFVATGHVELGARECCVTNYFLGADGMRYFVPVAGQTNYAYSNIYSSVELQQIGFHLNINLIPLINRSSESRWSLLVSPVVYGIGSKATIKASSDSKRILARDYRIGFGAGGNVALGYAITKSLGVRLGTGISVLAGNNLDGMPKSVHRDNFLWNSNLTLTWRFGKERSKTKSSAVPTVVPERTQVQQQKVEPVQLVVQDKVDTVNIEIKTVAKDSVAIVPIKVASDTIQITLPSIYFAFDSYKIDRRQLPAMNRILSAMQKHSEMEITVTGWSDPLGSKAVNKSISLKRAKAVGRWLANRGISAVRIKYRGMGVDKTQPVYKKARRADVTTMKRNK